jgi:HSP20 family molecular chaperone IbpA
MWEDWERLFKQVAKTSQQVKKAIDDFRGPEPQVHLYESDRQIKVVVNPVPEQKVRRWSVRVADERLFVRGLYTAEASVQDKEGNGYKESRSDEFVKAVRLPAPVEAKPYAYRKEGETLVVTFIKKKESPSSGWYDL